MSSIYLQLFLTVSPKFAFEEIYYKDSSSYTFVGKNWTDLLE